MIPYLYQINIKNMEVSTWEETENMKSKDEIENNKDYLFISFKKNGLEHRLKQKGFNQIDLREVLSTAINNNKKYIASIKVDISYSIQITGKFYSNPNYIQFIFDQLIQNAIGTMDISKSTPFIHIELVADAKSLKLEILDNGNGLTPNKLNDDINITALSASTDYDIGLYLIEQFIHRLSGKIYFDSALKTGTLIQVEIPNI